MKQVQFLLLSLIFWTQISSAMEPVEIYCNIRDSGSSLSCQEIGRGGARKVMTAEDISAFVDQGQIAAYVTLKSKKGFERTYLIDGNAAQYKKLSDVKKTASISEINRAKSELFNDIEKKLIKTSDDQDTQAAAAELVKYDSAVAYDKFKRESRQMVVDLDTAKKSNEKSCASSATYEQMLKANSSLQRSLSNILYAFESPGNCMSDFKIFKDKDDSVDLRQLDTVPKKFLTQCKK